MNKHSQCQGKTLKDTQCRNLVKKSGIYCRVHAEYPDYKVKHEEDRLRMIEQREYNAKQSKQYQLDEIYQYRDRFELVRTKLHLNESKVDHGLQCIECKQEENIQYRRVIIPELRICTVCFIACNKVLAEIAAKNRLLHKKFQRINRLKAKTDLVQDITNMPNVLMDIIQGYWIEN
jgi:hypothetical protein